MADIDYEKELNPALEVGDEFQVGVELASGEIMWGTVQTVTALTSEGIPYYRPKWAKVDKLPDYWRISAEGHRLQTKKKESKQK